MADSLNIGSSALLSLQQAMSAASHNIANVNTEGFSRQKVDFQAAPTQLTGAGYIGSGVTVGGVDRVYDQFLNNQVRNFTSSQSQYEAFHGLTVQVNNVFADSENSLNASLQNFFGALQDVADSPSTLPERQALLGEAANLVDRQQSFNNLLEDLSRDVNGHITTAVTEINSLTASIGKLNHEIVSAIGSSGGKSPNDLLDQRDVLLNRLAEKVNVTVTEQDDGAVNIFVGKGQGLVVGSDVTRLTTVRNSYDTQRLEIGIDGVAGNANITRFLKGGELQGALDFREKVLEPAQMQLGLLSIGLANTLNSQHQLGMDLDGNLGADFFTTVTPSAVASVNNAGTAAPTITIDDVSNLQASDYKLAYDGAQWSLTRGNDGTSVSGAGPLVLDGMTVDVGMGIPATGDSFLLKPAREALTSLSLAISDPRKIAMAAPVIASGDINNLGSGSISGLSVSDPTGLPLPGPISLSFNPDALGVGIPGFDVVGGPGGTIAYDPATQSNGTTFNFTVGGISFDIAGVPGDGDVFVIESNAGGVGDNRNGLLMGELQLKPLLAGNESSYQQVYSGLVADVGIATRQAEANLTVESSLLQEAVNSRESVSGVNLDEEAANLLKLQQSYQAVAQMVSISNEMFQTLIRATGN